MFPTSFSYAIDKRKETKRVYSGRLYAMTTADSLWRTTTILLIFSNRGTYIYIIYTQSELLDERFVKGKTSVWYHRPTLCRRRSMLQCRHTRPIAWWMRLLCQTDRRYDLSPCLVFGFSMEFQICYFSSAWYLFIFLKYLPFGGTGGSLEDGRMEGGVALSHGQLGSSVTGGNLYGGGGGAPRSTTSSSSSQSPPAPGAISASGKMSAPTSNGGGGGRKYQCKMCPQVGSHSSYFLFSIVLFFPLVSPGSLPLGFLRSTFLWFLFFILIFACLIVSPLAGQSC